MSKRNYSPFPKSICKQPAKLRPTVLNHLSPKTGIDSKSVSSGLAQRSLFHLVTASLWDKSTSFEKLDGKSPVSVGEGGITDLSLATSLPQPLLAGRGETVNICSFPDPLINISTCLT